jgi:serine protease Do
VIRNARVNKIRIRTADGRLLYPTKVWSDRGTDVAVLAMNAPSLVPAKVGDSADAELGDYVLAVGSPFGLSHSVTFGIISAKGRRDLQLGSETVSYQDFIQTDAAINPGNSGGPLMNLRGEVIGLNTAIASNSGGNDGIGFSIPINMAMAVAQQLIERGVVVRGYLGVHLDSRFNEETARRLGLERAVGARVSQVTAKSPAALARILVDDVILEFDGKPIQDDNQLVNLVSLAGVGRTVPVTIHRQGQRLSVDITLTDRERFEASDR